MLELLDQYQRLEITLKIGRERRKKAEQGGYAHINDNELKHELTLVLYDEQNLVGFDERSKKLIKEEI